MLDLAMQAISDNVRLLERLTLYQASPREVHTVPGSAEQLLLQGLQQLKAGNVKDAQTSLKQLAGVGIDSPRLEPLRSITAIKSWQAGGDGKQQFKDFVVKELGLTFNEDGPTTDDGVQRLAALDSAAGGTHGSASAEAPAAAGAAALPSCISPDQYSAAAFQADLDSTRTHKPADASSAINARDSSTLLQAVVDGSLGLQPTIQLLQDMSAVPPAALPVACLVTVLTGWQADWASSARSWLGQAGSVAEWQSSPVVQWVTAHWDDMTAEQVAAVRQALPGPAYGSNPDLDRRYAVACVRKALAGPAAVDAAAAAVAAAAGGDASAAGGASSVLAPWQSGAASASAAVMLKTVLAECDALGPAAEWIRVHALYAQLQQQRQQGPVVDVTLLNSFVSLLQRCTWSHGGPFARTQLPQSQQQQVQHPQHISCHACGMQPIVGPRFRSRSNLEVNLCSRCVSQPAAAAPAPYDEVTDDDSIYMLPELELPPVLQGMPCGMSLVEPELKALIQEIIWAAVERPGSQPKGAKLQLPSTRWAASVVAEAHLLSGKGDTAMWARQYEENGGSLEALRNTTELGFAADSRSSYSQDDDVVLQLHTKNTGTEGVLVKVYELNSWKLYTSTQSEADLNLQLAGVAPTRTLTLNTPADPLVRCRHSVSLGLAGRPGLWLVEVVAGSRRLRARISKGGLRLLQRPSVAGQVLTVMNEAWRPVQGVKVWCDGKEYTPPPTPAAGAGGSDSTNSGRACNEVLLPFAREECSTALVVSAQPLDGVSPGVAGAAKECVVLFRDFRRLREEHSLCAQLFCHQEVLLPGHTLQLLLHLNLQLHGTPAPLALLQDLQLSITAHTSEDGRLTQVFRELSLDEDTRTAGVSYCLPPNTVSLSAALTARVLLALPGVNGEPDHQQFDIQALLPGQTGLQHNVEIEGARQSSDIWDVYLTPDGNTSTTAADAAGASAPAISSSPAAPSYLLQVLGRCGEPPSAPKALSVWLDHVAFSPRQQLRFRVQTDAWGMVHLGPLQGVRQVKARFESGVDCVDRQPTAASGVSAGQGDAGTGTCAGDGSSAGPLRSWQVARPSFWVGGLQEQYVLAEGTTLEVPITPPAGQAVTATLLQLVSPALTADSGSAVPTTDAVVVADVTQAHLHLHPAADTLGSSSSSTRSAAGGGACSSSSSSSNVLGCGGPITISVQGLAAGLYRLLLPGLLLQPPDGSTVGWSQQANWSSTAVHIHVLPAAVTSSSSTAGRADGGSGGDIPTATLAADTSSTQEQWLYASPDFSSIDSSQPVLLQPSLPRQLHITSLTCSVAAGLSLQVAGPGELLPTVQVVLVFSRFLPDTTVSAAQLLPPQLPWNSTAGFGFSPPLSDQCSRWGFESGSRQGLGYGACPQSCGSTASCTYSQDAKLDSAVAYVLQRRQWEEAGGGRRPGVLLDRPSLLVCPHSVRSAAVPTSVLRGGDGGSMNERAPYHKHMKKAAMPMAACAGMMQQQQCAGAWAGAAAWGADECGAAVGFGMARQAAAAQTPVLGFLAQPAAVLTQLQLGADGALQVSPEQLQQLLSEAAGLPTEGPSAAAAQRVWDVTGYRVVYAAVFEPRTLGQSGAALCAVQGTGSTGSQAQQQQETAAGAGDSCLPAGALRDMGLDTPVDPGVVSALSCNVSVLHPGNSLTLDNPGASDCGVFGSLQQLYHLSAGLMEAAESGVGFSGNRAALQGLSRPCVPPGTQESASVLLRQWEPLLLQWPLLGRVARQDLVSRLASSDLMFFLAVKDRAAFDEMLLPLLECKLPSEVTCLEQVLLLQARHKQPAIPTVHQPHDPTAPAAAGTAAEAGATGTAAVIAEYDTQKQRLLQHWYAPHRYRLLNCLERLLLAALEGHEALLQLSTDLLHQLQSPAEKRGIKRTWMSRERRPVFEFALLLAQSLEQQQRESRDNSSSSSSDATSASDGDAGADADAFAAQKGGGAWDSEFVHVEAQGASSYAPGAPPVPAPPPMMAPMAASAPAPQAAMAFAAPPPPPAPARAMAARAAADLSARSRVASEAADDSNQVRVPKETREWAETGWWKCEGPEPGLIPVARFWAAFAHHLATQPPAAPFVPSDPTDVASSTAAVVAALAVADLPWEGMAVSSTATAAGSSANSSKGRVKGTSLGCSRSLQGSALTLTARGPCLVWVKALHPVAAVSSTDAALAATAAGGAQGQNVLPAGSSTAAAAVAAGTATATATAATVNSVLVVDRLYDPRCASSTDPETGEEVLLALQPSQQQPLLTGQRYCRSVIVTSTAAAERDLQVLVQLPQGAMALDGAVGTISRDIKLLPYTSMSLQQTLYFPQPGVYQQAPVSVVNVTGRPAWVPPAPAAPLHVVDPASLPDGGSSSVAEGRSQQLDAVSRWRRCVGSGDQQQLLDFLASGDLTGARLADISRFCADPAFFAAAVAALDSRHLFEPAVWKWSVVHLHEPALKQLLLSSELAQRLQTQHRVPVAKLLDGVFRDTSSSSSSSEEVEGAGDEVLRHLEYSPWVNPYCRPITHSGADANLPSVLRDNPAIAQQWKAFLLSLLMDSTCTAATPGTPAGGGSSGSSRDAGGSSLRLAAPQALAAAVFLLLQDRVDDAEEVLTANGCWDVGQGLSAPCESTGGRSLSWGALSMQRDYLAAWLALCRPIATSAPATGTDPQQGGSVGVGASWEDVAAEAVRVGSAVVSKYRGCAANGPWAKRFKQLAAMVSQLEQQQAAGGATQPTAASAAGAAQGQAAHPVLTVVGLEGSRLKLQVAGMSQLKLSAYEIDAELLFTTQPFSSFSSSSSSGGGGGGSLGAACRLPPHRGGSSPPEAPPDSGLGRVSFVQPTAQVSVQLQYGSTAGDPEASSSGADLPAAGVPAVAQAGSATVSCCAVGAAAAGSSGSAAEAGGVHECVLDLDGLLPGMQQRSVLLEVTGAGGLSRSLPRFASSLTVHVLEAQGVLQAYCPPDTAAGSGSDPPVSRGVRLLPAAAVYVKVYARHAGGDEVFYKDGYTDLRGRFDYVTLTSTADVSAVVRYSLLVASRQHGAVMLQAAPPPK